MSLTYGALRVEVLRYALRGQPPHMNNSRCTMALVSVTLSRSSRTEGGIDLEF